MTGAAATLLIVTGGLAIAGALGTIAAQKPLRAAVSLLVHVVSLAGLYLTLHAQLLAVIQMLVYAGAVVVLFVFVIMLIGPDAEEKEPNPRILGAIVSTILVAVIAIQVAAAVGAIPGEAPEPIAGYGTVESLGSAIYRDAGVPFELLSVTLLVAIVGAVAVARGRTADEAAEVRQVKAEREAAVAQRLAREAERRSAAASEGSAS